MNTGKRVRVFICVVVLGSWYGGECQTTAVGARSISLAGISALPEDSWAIANNPAGLARYNHASLATSLEQRFLMKELGFYSLTFTFPAATGCFGVYSEFSGYRSFIEQKISFGFGKLFGEKILTGLSLVYVFQKTGSDSWPVHQVSYKIGTIVIISDKVNLAFATFNPFQLYYRSKDFATLPSSFNIGLSYQYSPELAILSECEKDLDFPPILKIGMEYNIRAIFFIRGGIRLFPASWSFGAAVRHKRLLFEFASTYHQYLGYTPQFSFQFDLK